MIIIAGIVQVPEAAGLIETGFWTTWWPLRARCGWGHHSCLGPAWPTSRRTWSGGPTRSSARRRTFWLQTCSACRRRRRRRCSRQTQPTWARWGRCSFPNLRRTPQHF